MTESVNVLTPHQVEVPIMTDYDDPIFNDNNTEVSQWACNDHVYSAIPSSTSQLPSGQYDVVFDGREYVFKKNQIILDDLVPLPCESNVKTLKNIEQFWRNEDKFREHGFVWKRGILLWGPPGTGKTSIVQQVASKVIESDGIVIRCVSPFDTRRGLEILRKIEPNRRIIVIFEDIDAMIQNYGDSDLLALLDGEDQIDNVVYVATTNYPASLDDRFINRPSRFDEIIKVDTPTFKARAAYLKSKVPKFEMEDNQYDLQYWTEKTKGFSVAHLKELIISVECFDVPIDEAINTLNKMVTKTNDQYQHDEKTFGFAPEK